MWLHKIIKSHYLKSEELLLLLSLFLFIILNHLLLNKLWYWRVLLVLHGEFSFALFKNVHN
jgi:hypothetical protein